MSIFSFLSEENVNKHKEYLNNLKLQYSILEKSYKDICRKNIKEISKMKCGRELKNQILCKKAEIKLHEIYFNSFGEPYQNSSEISKVYNSPAEFIYVLCQTAIKTNSGFLVIYERRGEVGIYSGDDYVGILINSKPLLAIDLCEHAYFYDYGFDREEYIKNAASRLDLKKL